MSGSYKQCPECGKRALSVATRCPGCGREFPPSPERRGGGAPDLRRYLPLAAVAGALVAGAVLVTALLDHAGRAPLEEETSSVAAAPRLDTARVAASPAVGGPVAATAAAPAQRLVARTWTKVRNRRSTTGDVAAVLLPGDTVVVDSLSRGWWRVALEGEVLGYAHRSTLVAEGAGTEVEAAP